MNYGYFSPDDHEYVIIRPDTPRPWVNYLSNEIYNAIVSQTGGGFSYFMDCKRNRILDWENQHSDRPGRYVFIRDNASKHFWTINWQPALHGYQGWECRHGLGYTTIRSKARGIFGEITYFVPEDMPCEIWCVKLRNDRQSDADLSVFGFAKWVMGDYTMEKAWPNVMALYNRAGFEKKLNAVICGKEPNTGREVEDCMFFSMSLAPDAYDTVKEAFYGPYGLVCAPRAVVEGQCTNSDNCGEDGVAVLQRNLRLRPGEELEFRFLLGVADDQKSVKQTLRKYATAGACGAALEVVRFGWKERLEQSWIQTPDHELDRFTNIWGKYQLINISRWRSASHYKTGEGGDGYRDTAQDIEALLTIDLKRARRTLKRMLRQQFQDGRVTAGFSDLESERDHQGSDMERARSDGAIWLAYHVTAYLKETGDIGFLGEEIEFLDGDMATVIDHVMRAIDSICENKGPRGLPLFGPAGWNDAFDACGVEGRGESVWLAMALARAMKQVLELSIFIGHQHLAEELAEKYKKLKTIINEVAWDGQWYVRLFTDEGKVVGSSKCREAQIFLNTQTWAVLSGVADADRARQVLQMVDERLDTEVGPALFAPAYTGYDATLGRVTALAPGARENAAVSSHAAAFKIVADCMAGRAEEAFATYKKILPTCRARSETPDRYKVEPYVYAEYCIGPGHPRLFGEGAFTWQTGATPWMFSAVMEWMLGVRRDFTGLHIDPCVPSSWKEFWVRRAFRGEVYEISFSNPEGVNRGVQSVKIDGEEARGNVIPPSTDHRVHKVEVVMGVDL